MVSSPPPRQNYNQSKRLPIDLILLDKCPQLLLNNSLYCQYILYTPHNALQSIINLHKYCITMVIEERQNTFL